MRKMKVCFFSGDITRSGGTERAACMIANGLAAQKDYEVCVLSLVEQAARKRPFFYLDSKISHEALGQQWIQPGPKYLALIPKLRRFMKQREIDWMIDIDIVLDALAVPAAYKSRTKVISWEHFSFGYETSKRFFYRNFILRYVTTKSNRIITLTEKDRQAYLHGIRRLPPIRSIYNPVEKAPSKNVQNKKQWIITVGRLVYEKGIDYLLHTAEIVLKKYPDWQWLLLGDGDRKEWLNTQIQKRHLEKHLLVKGKVADVDAYLAQAQIFVLTSRREGLPMCLLEAKAHGLACVSFDIETGPDEIISDGVNGFLIPAYDDVKMAEKIGQLLEHANLRHTFMENAAFGIEKFRLETVLQQWNEVLLTRCE